MGIRKIGETDDDSGLTTFSEDTLKIEITRPSVCYLHSIVNDPITELQLRETISRSSMSLASFGRPHLVRLQHGYLLDD